MVNQRELLRATIALAAVLALTACATMRVNSYQPRGVDLGRYNTFRFGPVDRASTGDPRLDNNPFFTQPVQAAVERELTARGFEKTSSARADFLVKYHVSVRQEVEVNEFEPSDLSPHGTYQRDCSVEGCRASVYDKGTLFIDFVDPKTNKVVWRGWAEGTMDGVVDNQDWMEKRINEAVNRILRKLPTRA